MKTVVWIIILIIILFAVGQFVTIPVNENVPEGNEITEESVQDTDLPVPIEAEFLDKVVYTTDTSLEATPFENNCSERKGTFNSCGTICESDRDICAQVCAYTCELNINSQPISN